MAKSKFFKIKSKLSRLEIKGLKKNRFWDV